MAVTEHRHPCWTWTCDRCGEHPQDDEIGTPHYDSRAEATSAMEQWQDDGLLALVADRIICNGCADNAAYEVPCPTCGVAAAVHCEEPDRTVRVVEG